MWHTTATCKPSLDVAVYNQLSNLLFLFATVGFAWLPLFKSEQLTSQEHLIPVAANLPAGYLSVEDGSTGKVLNATSKFI